MTHVSVSDIATLCNHARALQSKEDTKEMGLLLDRAMTRLCEEVDVKIAERAKQREEEEYAVECVLGIGNAQKIQED